MKAQQVQKAGFALTALVAAIVFIPIVLVIVFIFANGLPAISWQFLTEAPRNGMTEGGPGKPVLLDRQYCLLAQGGVRLSQQQPTLFAEDIDVVAFFEI